MAPMNPLSRKAVGVVVYLAFLGITAEVVLQAFYYFTAGDFLFRRVKLAIYAPNEHSGHFNRPGLDLQHHTQEFTASYYTDTNGLRVPSSEHRYAKEKPDSAYRVMLLGPSFAFGWGVDFSDTFAAALERELDARDFAPSRDIEVINAGVPSMPAAPHLRWYENVGVGYEPDLVVQFIYGSMAVPNQPAPNAVVNDEGYLVHRNYAWQRRVRGELKKFATIFYGWVVWTKLDSLRQSDDSTGGEVLGAGRAMSAAAEFDLTRENVQEALSYYADLARVVRKGKSDLLVVYFPLSYAIHQEDVSRWKHLGVNNVADQIAFDRTFSEHLNEIGIPTKNITPELQLAAENGQRLYYWLDIHWTPLGNGVAATAVADHLEQLQ